MKKTALTGNRKSLLKLLGEKHPRNRVLFSLQEMRCSMKEPKTIYCPWCNRRVSSWDGRTTMNIIAHCKKCKMRVIYNPITEKTEIKEIPPRATSSGKTFY